MAIMSFKKPSKSHRNRYNRSSWRSSSLTWCCYRSHQASARRSTIDSASSTPRFSQVDSSNSSLRTLAIGRTTAVSRSSTCNSRCLPNSNNIDSVEGHSNIRISSNSTSLRLSKVTINSSITRERITPTTAAGVVASSSSTSLDLILRSGHANLTQTQISTAAL